MNEPSKEEQELDNSLERMGFFILLFVVVFFIGLFVYAKIFLKEEMKENAKYQSAINQLEVFAINQKEINIKIAEEYSKKTENHILNKGLYKDIVDENGDLLNSIIEKFKSKEKEIEVEIIVDNSFLKEFKEKNLEEIKAKIYDLAKKNNYGFLNQKEEKINFVKGLENYLVNYIQIGRHSSVSFKKTIVYLKQSDKEEISVFYKELMRLFPNREFYFTKNGELMVSAYESGIFETNFGGDVYGKNLRKGTKIILIFSKEKDII